MLAVFCPAMSTVVSHEVAHRMSVRWRTDPARWSGFNAFVHSQNSRMWKSALQHPQQFESSHSALLEKRFGESRQPQGRALLMNDNSNTTDPANNNAVIAVFTDPPAAEAAVKKLADAGST